MNRSLTLSFFLQKPKRFRLLSICANAVYNDVIQSLKDNSSIKIYTEFKNDEIHKEHISLSLSLSTCRCTLIFLNGCACTAHDKMSFQYISISVYIVRSHARIQRGGQRVQTTPTPPPEKSQKYRIS